MNLRKRATMHLFKRLSGLKEFNPLVGASFTRVGFTPTLAHKYIITIFR